MNRYNSNNYETEKFFGRINDVTDFFVRYKTTQFVMGFGMLIVMALLRSNVPFVAWLGSFLVLWVISYVYVGLVVFCIAAIYCFFSLDAHIDFEDLGNKLSGLVLSISFIANVVVIVTFSLSADPQQRMIDGLLFPFKLALDILGLFFGK